MAKKVKGADVVSLIRTFVEKSDKEVLSDLGLLHTDDLVDSMFCKLHEFEKAAFELLLEIDRENLDRRFGCFLLSTQYPLDVYCVD